MANSAEEVRCQFIPWNLCFSYPRSSKVLSSSVLRSDASQKADWLRQIKRAIEDKRKADAASGVLPPVMMLQFISACCYSSLAARAQVKVRRETEQKVTAVCAFEFIGPTIKLQQCETKSLNLNCFYRESKKDQKFARCFQALLLPAGWLRSSCAFWPLRSCIFHFSTCDNGGRLWTACQVAIYSICSALLSLFFYAYNIFSSYLFNFSMILMIKSF